MTQRWRGPFDCPCLAETASGREPSAIVGYQRTTRAPLSPRMGGPSQSRSPAILRDPFETWE